MNALHVVSNVATIIAGLSPESQALIESELSTPQQAVVRQMVARLEQREGEVDSFQADMRSYVSALGKLPYEAWTAVRTAIETDCGRYAADALRLAYREVYDTLPTKGDKRATGGTKGMSAKRYVNALATIVEELTQRLAKAPKQDLSPVRMARIAKLVGSLALELKAERKDLAA